MPCCQDGCLAHGRWRAGAALLLEHAHFAAEAGSGACTGVPGLLSWAGAGWKFCQEEEETYNSIATHGYSRSFSKYVPLSSS
jgi:hypothetical protein